MRPLVSVVVPAWNAERFLAEAIESVVAQTWPDWELLLADDGSTDRSPEIARLYAERHPEKIHCLEHPGRANRGESATRNLGLKAGKGDLFAFLDSDDVWLPEKLERQVPLLLARPEAGWLYGNTQYWFEDSTRDFAPPLGLPAGTLVEPPHLLTRFLRREAAVPCTCGLLVRREEVERIGGFDESFRSMYADQVFYARLALTAPVLVDHGCWERYRQHPDSTCAVSKKEGTAREARRIYLTWLERTLEERGVSDLDLRRALRRELRAFRHPRLDRALRWLDL
ncbi:MAG TPA: glycosyltransferase family A protein [Thermoanaerobaculia bacterium]|nr:glycosyltransferase family A protein [Thermoanaerobaculia bacterium]